MKNILFIIGTRPEAIKMAPLIKEFFKYPSLFNTKVCVTGQHKQMLDQVLNFFGIVPDYNLNLMQPNQTLFDLTALALKALEGVLENTKPDILFVQGDTTTAFVGSLAGYYKKIKVAHIEAGLRSGNKYSPFPEEGNRILCGHLADYHFAPTIQAKNNLAKEGILENVEVVGNTVIDALFLGLSLIKENDEFYYEYFKAVDFTKKIILVTAHRRESFGKPFEEICGAIKEIATQFKDVEVVYPVHLNPNVQEPVQKLLSGINNVHLIPPLDYSFLIWLMNKSYLVLTDSGGIQEEAPALGIPVLVMREVTERMEGVLAGTAKLVGTSKEMIWEETAKLLTDNLEYAQMAKAVNPYGDGQTSKKVLNYIMSDLNIKVLTKA
ncbi:MAG: UDP-N-acetylglucosamine 2-epimerase (non-hydrolyzing) [Bacteroidota bacterium]|nr:UDP-N-acetylglucosamine 2-epimerase (non-hydrolyzing) [Bacteroidota bacterium]